MKQVVYRYRLELKGGVQTIEMHPFAEIVHVAFRPSDDAINLWARVGADHIAPDLPRHPRRFRVVGTGHPDELDSADRYLGTVFVRGDSYVFHVFQVHSE